MQAPNPSPQRAAPAAGPSAPDAPSPPEGPSRRAAALRAERDRFVALAFCWADLLIELDRDRRVVFAAGPTSSVLGAAPDQLTGREVRTLIAASDHALVEQLLKAAESSGRIEDVRIRLQGPRGPTPPLMFAGYNLSDLDGHYFLALRVGAAKAGGHSHVRDPDSGLFDAESFSEIATHRLRALAEKGAEAKVTLVELPDFASLRGRLDADAERTLMNTVGACLRANSLGGDSAARIDEQRYSLVHRAEVDVADLRAQIAGYSRLVDPLGEGIDVQSASIEMDAAGVSDEDLAKGLVYAINQFRQSAGDGFTIRRLSTSLSSLVSEAVSDVNTFKQVVADASFEVAFQPIIDVWTGEIHHYEALARFPSGQHGESPYRYISFAEETGLIHDFDIAMARKVVAWLALKPRNSERYHVAVNISGNSLGTLSYVTELHNLLHENPWVRDKLMFEITESARMADLDVANRVIQSLRAQGCRVCLDDFGAGAASFQYLSVLDVDVVKLDGSAVRNAQRVAKGQAFLSALSELCRRLGVETIAEMIDDPKGLDFVRECGVDYVQGYLFGKPSRQVRDFDPLPRANLFGTRRHVPRPGVR